MPNRIIKESIWDSPSLNRLSDLAERHFYRLLPAPDDFGCWQATSSVVKGRLYPRKTYVTEQQIMGWYAELERENMCRFWVVGERLYGMFVNFKDHQRIRSVHQRKTPSPPENIRQLNTTIKDILNSSTFDDKCQQVSSSDRLNPNPNPIKIDLKDKSILSIPKTESTEEKPSPPKKPKPQLKPKPDSRVQELFEFWQYKFEGLYHTPPILKFARDGKLIKDLLGYADNNSQIPPDCKTLLIAMCMDDYLDEQDKREENYKNPTITGFNKAFETLITQINWDDPNWERMKKEYAKERDEIEKRKVDPSGSDQTPLEHALV